MDLDVSNHSNGGRQAMRQRAMEEIQGSDVTFHIDKDDEGQTVKVSGKTNSIIAALALAMSEDERIAQFLIRAVGAYIAVEKKDVEFGSQLFKYLDE